MASTEGQICHLLLGLTFSNNIDLNILLTNTVEPTQMLCLDYSAYRKFSRSARCHGIYKQLRVKDGQ